MSGIRVTGRSGGRAKPGGGYELAVWYLMRLTGLGLFVLALSHFIILHVLYDPACQRATFISQRWADLGVRTADWLMLAFVCFHAFMGMRTIVQDYSHGGVRTVLTMGLYLGGLVLFVMGSIALLTLPTLVQPPQC